MDKEHTPVHCSLPERLEQKPLRMLEVAGDAIAPAGRLQRVQAVPVTRRHRRVNHRRRWLFRGVDRYRQYAKIASKVRNGSLDVHK